jgi:hypothetical protein
MSESLPIARPTAIQFCTLPDDVLRVVGEFMPQSALIKCVRCSQRLAVLLRDELISRLDGLFVVQSSPLSSILSDLGTVFEELAPSDRADPTFIRYEEASRGYDGPPYPGFYLIRECMLSCSSFKFSRLASCRGLIRVGRFPISATSDTRDAAKVRFLSWLQHLRRRLAVSEALKAALGNAIASRETLTEYLGEFCLFGDSRNFITNDED